MILNFGRKRLGLAYIYQQFSIEFSLPGEICNFVLVTEVGRAKTNINTLQFVEYL